MNLHQAENALLHRWFGVLRCPRCLSKVSMCVDGGAGALQCEACAQRYPVENDIPRLLKPDRAVALEKFCAQYDALRLQEGWASAHPNFYLALPFRDLSGRHVQEWRLRAKSFQLVQAWLEQHARGRTLRILEVGAGSGWMSQLLARHHEVLAFDANAGPHGLCAIPSPQRRFMAVQAELDCLPLSGQAMDVIIANASLHYAPDAEVFLAQAQRVLRPQGRLLVMDSPVYANATALAAAHQRTRAYYTQLGFPDLAQNYGGLCAAQFEKRGDFVFSRLRRDFSKFELCRKYLREKLGKPAAARFPVMLFVRRD